MQISGKAGGLATENQNNVLRTKVRVPQHACCLG